MSTTALEKVESAVMKTFSQKTPAKHVKSRPGAGGRMFKYVDTGFVVNELNRLFGIFWEWKVTDKHIDEHEIWVQGELTIKGADGFSVTKTGFGSAKVKHGKDSKLPLDIGNDLKAASTLAMKKAASLFGIASDIYYPEMDWYEEKSEETELEEPDSQDVAANTRAILNRKMFALAAQKGVSEQDIDKVIKKQFNLESKKELTSGQLQELIQRLEAKPDKSIETVAAEVFAAEVVEEKKEEEKEAIQKRIDMNEDGEGRPLCLNLKCTKGENGQRAVREDPEKLFCSLECRKEYDNA